MKIEYFTLICCCLLLFSTESCEKPADPYEERIASCLSKAEVIPFTTADTGESGFSHTVEPECLVGVRLPDFEATGIDGQPYSTPGIYGKINVINFWFIQCKPCIVEIPYLNNLVAKYGHERINFLALTRDSISALQPFLRKHPFHFKVLPDSEAIIKKDFNLLWGYPCTFVTDHNNVIIDIIANSKADSSIYEAISETIDSLLLTTSYGS